MAAATAKITFTAQLTTMAILVAVNLINYWDRQTIAAVLGDLLKEFEIPNSQGGLLQTCFVLAFMVFAPPFGYAGDRYSRRYLMATGVLIWSFCTAVGSAMETFVPFLVFRALVGIGEASYSTIAPTIISDMFEGERRSMMLAIFYFAIPIGSGLGYIVGSEMNKATGSWRWALRVTPVLGMIATVLILTALTEPPRPKAKKTSYGEDIKELVINRSFILNTLAFTCVCFVTGGLGFFGPIFIENAINSQHAVDQLIDPGHVSTIFGAIAMFSGIAGVGLGFGLQKAFKGGRSDPLICGIGLFVSAVFMSIGLLITRWDVRLAFAAFFFALTFMNMNWAIVPDMLLYTVMPNVQGTAIAAQILVSHAFGDAGSPFLIGVISDFIKAHFGRRDSAFAFDVPTCSDYVAVLDKVGFLNHPRKEPEHLLCEAFLEYRALQYSFWLAVIIEVIGGVLFIIMACFVVGDKKRVDDAAAKAKKRSV